MTTSPAVSAPRDVSTRHPARFSGVMRSTDASAQRDALPPARVEQPFVIERRVQARRALDDHAAMVIIARDLRALLVARHHIRPGLRRIVEPREALFL